MWLRLCLSVSPSHPSLAHFLSHLLLYSRIMAFVALSLILSWASLGAGTAAAVVRKTPFLKYLFKSSRALLVIFNLTTRRAELTGFSFLGHMPCSKASASVALVYMAAFYGQLCSKAD